ncbi:aspartate/glutamate racemase family protein [Marinococcus halophilus]|uniref:Aspartate racemase n=1 Tax=Marinococcus halophilus TaxID=1371 RepID=A0A510Y6U6_MARHA|nr:aspartate/glutamate racemase family protein [Marinococcus halophilus]OZT79726.1 aspartate/glutamate racemase family protein [Marinococcus halophilus]GEK59082.1 aspartate racemase [Marinococcus halophilus]
MQMIGLLGGMSWESSALYYQLINEEVNRRLGRLHSARCLMYSVDFEEIEQMQATGSWEEAGERLGEAAAALERGGADFIVLCTNTMHKVIGTIEGCVNIPVLPIAEAAVREIRRQKLSRAGLLGTKYTMEETFYTDGLRSGGLEVTVPDPEPRAEINRIIFEELCHGTVRPESKSYMLRVMEQLKQAGAEGIILGCTELGMLVTSEDTELSVIDTTRVHALEAVNEALKSYY